jgi:lysophospholipase L1-like esterase
MPSTSIKPAAFAISRAMAVTVTGSGTSWTSGTTFSVSGGVATISGLTVNAGSQTATFTLNPGPSTGTLTISNSTDASTCTVSVASSVTVSGTGLTAWTADTGLSCFDAVNEFTADAVGHVINISGGSGFTAGPYSVNTFSAAVPLGGGQGTHNVVQICAYNSNTVGPGTNTATGGAWNYVIQAGGNGLAGSNLTAWQRDTGFTYYFDPDAPVDPSMNGATITIAGTQYTSGTYTISGLLTAWNTAAQGVQNLIQIATLSGHEPTSTQFATGGTWIKAGGAVIPTPTVNPAFTGAIKVGLIGTSITALLAGSPAAALTIQYPNASSVTVSVQGQSGSVSADWLIGAPSGYLTSAIAAFNADAVTIVNVELGANDSKTTGQVSTATFITTVQAICASLFANVPTLQRVYLQEQSYIVPGSFGVWDSTSNTAMQAYFAAYATISTSQIIQGVSNSNTNFAFFQSNQQLLRDGVHPTMSGFAEYTYTWLTSFEGYSISVPAAGVYTVTSNFAFQTGDFVTLGSSAGTITVTAAGATITGNTSNSVETQPANAATSYTFKPSATSTVTPTSSFPLDPAPFGVTVSGGGGISIGGGISLGSLSAIGGGIRL